MSDTLDEIAVLMEPIDEQITNCETPNEQIMLACGMMQRVKEILNHHLGKEQATKLLREYADESYAQ